MVNRLFFKALFFFVVMSFLMGIITTFFLVTQAERLIREQALAYAQSIALAAKTEFGRLQNTREESLSTFFENQMDVGQVLRLRVIRPDGTILASHRYFGSGPKGPIGDPPVEPLDGLVNKLLEDRPYPDPKYQLGDLVGSSSDLSSVAQSEWATGAEPLKTALWVTQRGFNVGILEMEFSLREAVRQRERAQDRFWLVLIIWGIAFTLAQTLLLSKWILFPVHYLMRVAQRVASGEEGARATISGTDEMAELGKSLNHMADSLGAQKEILESQNKELLQKENIVQQELRLARVVQNELLKTGVVRAEGVECLGRVLQMNEVGGDFFEAVQAEDGSLIVAVGDVSGKGVPAALVMVLVMSELRDVLRETQRPGELLEKLNHRLFERLGEEEIAYVTMLILRFEPSTKLLSVARAAHPAPLLLTAGQNGVGSQVLPIQAKGLPLGIEPTAVYVEKDITLTRGDRVFMFSDGVHDLRGEKGALSDEELRAMVLGHADTPGIKVVDELFHEFCTGGLSRKDDLTLVGLNIL